jgi:DNA-binding NtrC family response regulator
MLSSPKILYVEDDDDIRGIVTQALLSEGFEVNPVSSAEDALRDLSAAPYDVLLTDYRLPGENAAWLLRESEALGLLEKMPVIVFSAETNPTGIEGHTFLRKPIDLDVLSAAIATALRDTVPANARISDLRATEPKLLLTLYVTPTSHVSQKAIRNLHRVLKKFDPADYRVVIRDVARAERVSVQSVEEDRIVVTPTLVARTAAGKIWLAGDLSDASMVEDVITRGLAALALRSA